VGGREKERERVKNVVTHRKQERAGSRQREKEREKEKNIRGFIKKHN